MLKTKVLGGLLCCSLVVFAQGPGPRGGGPGGRGGPGGFGGGRGMGILGSGRVVTGAPYSATEVRTLQEKFADGNSVNQTTRTPMARDSQGRTYVNETITPPAASGKAPYSRITISDPVAGYHYVLDSSTMIAIQSRMPKMFPASTSTTAPAAPTLPTTQTLSNGATITTTSLGTSTINGVGATGTQVTEVIPAGAIGNTQAITITRTTWISTLLKLPVQIKSSDPRSGTSDMELTNISTGEPSASLFLVPAGYTIQKGGPGGPGGPFGGSGGAHSRPGPGGPGGPGGLARRGGPGQF